MISNKLVGVENRNHNESSLMQTYESDLIILKPSFNEVKMGPARRKSRLGKESNLL